MVKRVRAFGILGAGIGLGSLRDFLFINLNYEIDHVQRATSISFAHSRFRAWVEGHEMSSLLLLKWILAALFIAAMWALSLLLLRNAGVLQRLFRPVTVVFLGIAAVAALLHLLSHWVPVGEASVNLLHAIQYPVLLIMLQVALIFFPGTRAEHR